MLQLFRSATNRSIVEMAEFSQHCTADNVAFDGDQDDAVPSSSSSPPIFTITVPETTQAAKLDPEAFVVSMEEPEAGTSSQQSAKVQTSADGLPFQGGNIFR